MIMTKLSVRYRCQSIGAPGGRGGRAAMDLQPRQPAAQSRPRRRALPPVAKDSVKFLVLGDTGTGDRAQNDTAPQVWKSHACSRTSSPSWWATTSTARSARRTSTASSRCPTSRCSTPTSRSTRRWATTTTRTSATTSRSAWAASASTPIKRKIPVLRPRQQLHGQGPAALAGEGTGGSNSKWKIAYFHHPIYSSGATHGSEVDLRTIIEPLFNKYGDQRGLRRPRAFLRAAQAAEGHHYFTAGGSAKLRSGDIAGGDHRQGLRHRTELHDGGARWRRHAVPDDLEARQAGRLRRDHAPEPGPKALMTRTAAFRVAAGVFLDRQRGAVLTARQAAKPKYRRRMPSSGRTPAT